MQKASDSSAWHWLAFVQGGKFEVVVPPSRQLHCCTGLIAGHLWALAAIPTKEVSCVIALSCHLLFFSSRISTMFSLPTNVYIVSRWKLVISVLRVGGFWEVNGARATTCTLVPLLNYYRHLLVPDMHYIITWQFIVWFTPVPVGDSTEFTNK